MPRVLITGGAGFIGSHTARLAQKRGWSVHVLDNLSTGQEATFRALESEGIEVTLGDVRDTSLIDKVVLGCDAVIHLAAQVSVPYSLQQPKENHAVNVGGTSALIEAAKKHGISRFITASSAAVYGTADTLPLDEDEAGHFHSPYAESKWLNEEQILKVREQGMEAIALRLFNVYGPGQKSDGAYAAVIPKFIELISQGSQPIIFGDGLQTRDFIHVDDVAKALLMFSSIPWQERFHHVYNVATETECSLLDLVQAIQVVFTTIRPEIPLLKPLHKPARLGDIQRSAASIQRIQNDTQWSPSIAFQDGLREQILDRLNTK
jgi:nucleoside-diphosphate-sugar epimerase